jgi:hypothetical protein
MSHDAASGGGGPAGGKVERLATIPAGIAAAAPTVAARRDGTAVAPAGGAAGVAAAGATAAVQRGVGALGVVRFDGGGRDGSARARRRLAAVRGLIVRRSMHARVGPMPPSA